MFNIRSWLPIYWPNAAGRFSFVWRGFGVHLLPKKDFVEWGFEESWYDGPQFSLGFGPILLITWSDSFWDAIKTETK